MICKDCKHSEDIKGKRHCGAIEGKPVCLNAREPKEDDSHECGPEAKLFDPK